MTALPTPEWHYPIEAANVADAPHALTLTASDDQCAALARRFDLPWIKSLTASVTTRRQADGIIATGNLHSDLAQRCVATDVELPVTLDTPFTIRFRHATDIDASADEEIELDADDCDTVDYTGHQIDLGEALADTLYLALDTFPRSPDADAVLKAAGVKSEGEAGPFGALAGLLKK